MFHCLLMELQLTLLLWEELHPSLDSILNKILEWHYDMSETQAKFRDVIWEQILFSNGKGSAENRKVVLNHYSNPESFLQLISQSFLLL